MKTNIESCRNLENLIPRPKAGYKHLLILENLVVPSLLIVATVISLYFIIVRPPSMPPGIPWLAKGLNSGQTGAG